MTSKQTNLSQWTGDPVHSCRCPRGEVVMMLNPDSRRIIIRWKRGLLYDAFVEMCVREMFLIQWTHSTKGTVDNDCDITIERRLFPAVGQMYMCSRVGRYQQEIKINNRKLANIPGEQNIRTEL